MIDIAMLRTAVKAGMPASAIVDMVETSQKLHLEKIAVQRDKNRIRQRNHRSRNRDSALLTVTPEKHEINQQSRDCDIALHENSSLTSNTSLESPTILNQVSCTSTRQDHVHVLDHVLAQKPCQKTNGRQKYPAEFETEFWEPYPRTPIMAKKDAFAQWKRLPDDDRKHCIAALEPYKRYLAEHPTCDPVHACRFISQRRFDGFMTEESRSGPPSGLTEEQLRKYELGWRPWMEEKDGNDRGGLFAASTSVYPADRSQRSGQVVSNHAIE